MRFKYHKQIVDILYKELDLGKTASQAKGKTCAWIFWFGILSEAEKIVTEKVNNVIVGICSYTKWNSKKHIFRKKTYRFLTWSLIHSPLVKNKNAIYKYDTDYDYLPKELANYFDGEITVLIVDKKYRGKQLGKNLLNKIFDMARRDNMKNIQILSDESCNYQFYETLGCIKVYEKIIPNNEPYKCGNTINVKGFIYEKKLKI